ncbi:citrate lyase subunit beta/citryl-CoA lyase [Arthrobacter ginsengisoli]|uniref:Citrate lyase subunit beta/citryl-CoA lyase n=1 Tax=Arthrobacter ginsengisoli TaxID=1356565 RepID=A0ABU1UDZ9_9MICC|nr:CoA ester lyase [Arthrobacter ginsengisoli]MDR7083335.1 citrate lyase subunit beta/citryl-CoA lyase [Arthrobacter ginsengisoli]
MTGSPIAEAATALFVPGHRADRFAKAVSCGADLVIVDWEDAVPADMKVQSRRDTLAALTSPDPAFWAAVRINALSEGGAGDLDALGNAFTTARGAHLRAVLLPKAESLADVETVAAALPGVPIVPLVETAAGLAVAVKLAASPAVVRLGFGALDFGVDVDATSAIMLDHARCALVLASRAAGLGPPLDSPNPEFRNENLIRSSATSARALGMGGQLCIHPNQVPIVADAFTPTRAEIAWAQRVVDAGDYGAIAVDGAMVDRPVFLRAERILARAAR